MYTLGTRSLTEIYVGSGAATHAVFPMALDSVVEAARGVHTHPLHCYVKQMAGLADVMICSAARDSSCCQGGRMGALWLVPSMKLLHKPTHSLLSQTSCIACQGPVASAKGFPNTQTQGHTRRCRRRGGCGGNRRQGSRCSGWSRASRPTCRRP